MSKPRNPRYFPRMKVRGASRRMVAPYQRAARGFDGISASVHIAVQDLLFCMENYVYYRPPFMSGADQVVADD